MPRSPLLDPARKYSLKAKLSQFASNQIAEWSDKYINYATLLEELQRLRPQLDSIVAENTGRCESPELKETMPLLLRPPSKKSMSGACPRGLEHLGDIIVAEHRKSFDFFAAKHKVFHQRKQTVQAYVADPTSSKDSDFKDAIIELYRGYLLLRNFSILNANCESAVLKELDETLSACGGQAVFAQFKLYIKSDLKSSFHLYDEKVRRALNELVNICAQSFCGGDVEAARGEMEKRRQKKPAQFKSTFRLGIGVGMCIPWVLIILYCIGRPQDETKMSEFFNILPIYRCTMLIILTIWSCGLLIFTFEGTRVNYSYILELNMNSVLDYNEILQVASLCSALWCFCFSVFVGNIYFDVTLSWGIQRYHYYCLYFGLLIFILGPWYRSTKKWLLHTCKEVVTAPFHRVTFASNFIGDYLTSTSRILVDVFYSSCWVIWDIADTGVEQSKCSATKAYAAPFIMAFPLLCRFLQCCRRSRDSHRAWPHLFNAFKYALSLTGLVISSLNPSYTSTFGEWPPGRLAWLAVLIVATAYSFLWDLCMDWGVVVVSYESKLSVKYSGRRLLNYSWPLLINFIGRIAWTYNLLAHPIKEMWYEHLIVFAMAMIEIIRRCVWSYYRIQNEHFNNCGEYRETKEIPLRFSAGTMYEPEVPAVPTVKPKKKFLPALAKLHVLTACEDFIHKLRHSEEETTPNSLTSNRSSKLHL